MRFPGRYAMALAAAFAGDPDNLARAFRGLSDDAVATLGRELLHGLDQAAKLTGNRDAWAFVSNRIPWPHVRAGAAELQARIDVWASPAGRQAPSGRRQLGSLAMRLLRQGASAAEVLQQLHAANLTLATPLQSEGVREVAVWAARARQAPQHAA